MSDVSERLAALSPKERAALAMRLARQARAGEAADQTGVARRRAGGPAPLSFAQQRLWFIDRLTPDSAFYNIPEALRLFGRLDIKALERSLGEIVRRHEALRTSFTTDGGRPVQVVHDPAPLTLEVADLSRLPEAEREQAALRLAVEEAHRPFELSRAPLTRAGLLRLGPQEHILLITTHHIVSDDWSVGVFLRELSTLYGTYLRGEPSPLPELPVQYADFAAWQRGWLQGEVLERQVRYWKQQLGGELPVLNLPTDRPRPPVLSYEGADEFFELPEELTGRLKAFSRREGATLFMTLLAAFNVLLHRYTGQTDIVVGTPIAGRNRREVEGLIGFFVNSLVMRTDVSGRPSFRELLGRVKEVTLGAFAHQDVPFEKLVEELHPERDLSRTPLFQVMLSLENTPLEDFTLPGLQLGSMDISSDVTRFDLEFHLWEGDGALAGNLIYNTDLFAAATIARMLGHFRNLLEGVVADPAARPSDLPLLSGAERRQVLAGWNDTRSVYPRDRCVHELFEAQAARAPDAVAVVSEEGRITYGELNARANRLARRLRALGVGPEGKVGVLMRRSPEMVAALLAVLKAGGGYVPLDLSYPRPRLQFMLEDAGVQVVLTERQQLGALPDGRAEVVCLDGDRAEVDRECAENLPNGVTADNLAYIIYTSGSTGRPKGVGIEHRAINRLVCETNYIELSASDRVAQASTASFDAATFEIWGALLHGAQLDIIPREIAISPQEFAAHIREQGVSVLFLTPALFNQIAGVRPEAFGPLRCLLIGGDALDPRWVREVLSQGPPRRLLNAYGPTENTTFSTWHAVGEVAADPPTIPIGGPVMNTQAYVLDGELQPVPFGVAGELCLGGDGLMRGYHSRPELTAEKLVPHPFSTEPGARLYRTGDLVRFLPEGPIEFLGRIDRQVKVRGFRIEPGEIEAVVGGHESVGGCVVVVCESAHGGKRLVAYVAPRGAELPGGDELRRHARERLPEYMIPAAFVMLDALPLDANGKVNRRALPAPDMVRPELEKSFVAPRTPVEERVAEIWCQVLGVGRVGVHDNFFDLGGHSLVATQIVSRLCDAFEIELPLRCLFESPTVAGLSVAVAQRLKGEGDGARRQIQPRGRAAASFPLSFAQQRLWFLNQLQPDSQFYNVPDAYRLHGRPDVGALERSFDALVRRHETLRTTFDTLGGEPRQFINEPAPFVLPLADLTNLSAERREAEALRLAEEEAERLFDLRRDPMLRAGLLRMGEEEHVLLMSTHHIASDGWSRGVLVDELMTLYEAFGEGRAPALAELPVQYADYAAWQREYLAGEALDEQLSYWKERLGGELPVLGLPTDRPRPPIPTYRGAYYLLGFSEELSAELHALSRRAGVTLYMVLLAAFDVLLYRYTGQSDLVVGTPTAGRNRREVEGLIGFFVNTLVMRTDLGGDPTFRELLGRVREVALGAQANQDVPFEKLVEELHPERDLSRNPLFQVAFGLQNAPTQDFTLRGLTVTPMEVGGGSSKFDLEFHLWESGAALDGACIYSTDLFEEASVARLFTHYVRLLEGGVAAPDTHISELPLLTEGERQQMLVRWNQTGAPYPRRLCIHQLFEAQAARTPERVALIFGKQRLTYAELNRRANRLAYRLRAAGVVPEVLVGVFAERSVEMVVGLLAVLKAGGAYLPLDPRYPRERLAFMLADTAAPVLITQQHLSARLPPQGARVILLDADREAFDAETAVNPSAVAAADNLAYVIYTSGSTGRPKGVAIEHRSAVTFLDWATGRFTEAELQGTLASTSICFDLSIFELFAPLACGGSVVLAENALALPALPAAREVTLVNTVPSAMAELVRTGGLPASVRTVNLAGEPLKSSLAEEVYRHGHVRRVYNLYGPSEDTTYSTEALVGRGAEREPTIGRPIANSEVYLLDERRQPVPVGVRGEMYLGGAGLARCYLNCPDATAERFIPDPFGGARGARLYRTGDLARYLPDGQLELIGRVDHQVKIRGFRIEPGEIETALVAHPKVREAAVIARGDAPGEKRLIAYVERQPGAALDVGELRAFLRAKLPEYMTPSGFVPLDEMPRTANGKLDRRALRALPEPEAARRESFVAPRDALEQQLAQIWEDVLKARAVGVRDNFFDLGGHSLLATRVVSHVRERCGVELPLRVMFESPTVEGLALHVKSAGRGQEDLGRLAGMLDRLEQLSEEEVRALLESAGDGRPARPAGGEAST